MSILLAENEIWDVINYVRALGSGRIQPESKLGGNPFDPVSELVQRAEMLQEAVKNNVLSQEETEIFDRVHTVMDEFIQTEGVSGLGSSTTRSDALPQILGTLVENGWITENQASIFLDVHDRLVDSGLME